MVDPNEKSHYLTFLNAIYIAHNASIKGLDKASTRIWILAQAFLALLKTLISGSTWWSQKLTHSWSLLNQYILKKPCSALCTCK